MKPAHAFIDELTSAPPTFGTPWYLYMCPAIVRLGNPNPKLHYSRAFRATLFKSPIGCSFSPSFK